MNKTHRHLVSSIKSTGICKLSKGIYPNNKLIIGNVVMTGNFPFMQGSLVLTISVDNTIDLARNEGVVQFDEESQTPYFNYTLRSGGREIEHIVWFIDARSIDALLNLLIEHELLGNAIWNIMN